MSHPEQEHIRLANIINYFDERDEVVIQHVETETGIDDFSSCTLTFKLKSENND